jgi:hypothetical protein
VSWDVEEGLGAEGVDEEFNQRRARAMSFSKERRRPAW